MIAWINVTVLVISTLLCLYFYIKSAGPAALEKKIGPDAYKVCTRHRLWSSVFMTLAFIEYVIYVFYPLPLPLPRTFPWNWGVSVLIAVLISIPSGYIWIRGMRDAGEETMVVKKEHTMYGGIYEKIRHPQAVGELPFWWVLAFVLHSPFLVIYSFVWIPVFLLMCYAEEKDLAMRYGKAYLNYKQHTGAFFPKTS